MTGRTTTGTRVLATALAGLALALVATLVPVAPAAAAPPAVTHAALVEPTPNAVTAHILDTGPCAQVNVANCRTEAVLDLGTRVIVGGNFSQVKRYSQPTVFSRPFLFAYDKATGAIDTGFLPNPNGKVTSLLRASDGTVLVGGQFTSIGGRAIPYAAKLNPTTGAASATFAPRPDGMVYDMHQAGGHLYLGGSFTRVGGQVRTNFAAVDPATGAVRTAASAAFASAPRGITRVMRFDVSPNGKKLVAIGNFARVGGQVRENVAVLDLTTNGGSTVAGWRTDRYKDLTCGSTRSPWDTPIYDVDMDPTGAWFVIVTTGGPGGTTRLCDTAARWETGSPGAVSTPTWVNWTGGDSLTAVAVTGTAVYVAGHNRWLDNPQGADSAGPGAVERSGIGALSPTTGKALSWNPGRDRGFVATRLVPTADGLYVLSDALKFNGAFRPRLAYLTLPRVETVPSAPGVPSVTAASATTATVSWTAAVASSPILAYTVVARRGSTTVATKDVGTARSTTMTGLPAGQLVTFSVTARSVAGTGPAATSAPALPPFTSIDAFTTQQHRDLLGRAPTSAELSSWRSRISGASVTPQAAVDELMASDSVGEVATVVRLYRAYYRRAPDAGGFRYWRDKVRGGMSVNQVSQYFASLPEFRSMYGSLGDAGFVDLVYENVLGRSPDAAGRTYWVGKLRGGHPRGRLMTQFSESPENKTASAPATDVALVIHLMLDRLPTTSDRAWRGTRAELVRTVLVSAEYDRRV